MSNKVLTPKQFLLLALLTISSSQASGNWLTCYSQPNGAVLPVEADCHVYIYCLDQTPFTIACPFGMGFSASQGYCVALGQSDCATNAVTPTSQTGRVQGRGTCDNEKREANKQACKGQAFGELVPYPGDCSKFLVCNCEYPTVKQCQGGTWFDIKIKTCNYPQYVDCNDGSGSGETTTTLTSTSSTSTTTLAPLTTATMEATETTPKWGEDCEAPAGMSENICLKYNNGVLLRYPYNCNAYINCTMGCPVMNYCPHDKVFNNFLKICDTPDTAQCIELPLPPATSTTTEGTSSSTEESTSTTTDQLSSSSTTTEESSSSSTTTEESTTLSSSSEITTTTESSTEWGKDCKAPPGMSEDICFKYNNGLLLRYPYDCNVYINCTVGCPVMNYCPPDKVFNDLLKICDTPDTAHCIELPMPPTTTTEETSISTTAETTSSTTEETSNTGETSTSTPEETSTSTTEETFTSTTEETSSSTEVTTSSTTEQPDICIPPLAVDDDICSSETQSVFQPYPYNCTAYIKCKAFEPCLKYCEPGKTFNSLLGICDEDIECDEIPLPTITTQKPTTTTQEPITTTTKPLPPNVNPDMCEDKEDYTIYPYEQDCSQYLLCLDGKVKLESCPEDWLFNAQLMLCDKASEEVCYTGLTTTPEATTTTTVSTTKDPGLDLCENQPLGKTFPYKDNCQLYYYCKGNGEYFLISCPYNNYYDPYTGDCGPNVSPTACQEPLTTTQAPTTPAPTLSPEQKCANQAGGVTYPYVEDCSKYIYCMGNGGYVIMNCPYNNYYYPDTGDCGPSDDINICRKPLGSTTMSPTPPETTTAVSVTTPSTVLGICGNYTNGQLIPYPDNCQKYISCVKPIPIGFYCYNNWYFDVTQQKCVPDEQGICSVVELPGNETTTVATSSDICQGLKEGDRQIYPSNCQFYYECLGDGYYMLKICEQGEYFDPVMGQCSAEVSADYCKQNFNTTLAPPTTPKPKPQGICAGKEQGDMIAYPKNCSKYIVCENPIPVGFNCAEGLEFSTVSQKCVEPHESDCSLLTSTPCTTTTLEPTTKPYNQCTDKPDFTLLPYKKDCAMFIICLKDEEHWAYCPQGEYFDLLEMQCTKEGNEDSCLIRETTTTTEASTTTTQDPNLGPCYNKPYGTKIPYPNNCTKYIVCQEPLNVGYDCPEGLEFSIYYDECVIPELANCSIKTTSTTSTTTEKTTTPLTPETCENKPTGSSLPYPEDCSKYYMCINGQEILTNCMPNSYYNPKTGDCDPDVSPTACQGPLTTTTPQPTPPQGTCNEEDNGYIYSNEENCSQYYMCLNDTSILCQCQNQTYYNPYTKECDAETSNNECKESLTSSSIKPTTTTEVINSSSSTEEPKTSTENSSTTESSNNSTVETTTSTSSGSSGTTLEPTYPPEHSQDNICCGKKSGTYLPYPGDNSRYVICLYPVPEVHSCVEGGIYDPETLDCKLVTPFSLTKPDCTESRYGDTIVYDGDCTKYYFCYGSEAVLLDCSFDWNYDPSIEQCVPKNQYKCPW